MNSVRIRSVECVIVDLPLKRLQRFSALGANDQSFVIIFIRSDEGAIGIGEAVTPSGPWWGGESVESIKLHIDRYLAPLLVGADAFAVEELRIKMDQQLHGNHFAKAGIEMAVMDLIGKTIQQPLYNLFGGKVRESLAVSWPLATGDADAEIAEAEEKLDLGLHRVFKLKMGALPPEEDVARACKIARALEDRASVRADPNEMWSESVASWAMQRLADAGLELMEQPLPRWNLAGSARLQQRFDMEMMLDESMCSVQDMLKIGYTCAARSVSLKVMKSGGLRNTKAISEIASAAGISVYMGTFLESSLGTAANMQLCATLSNLPFGGELIGPLLLADDLCEKPAIYKDFRLWLAEDGPGIGVTLDKDKLKHYQRDRSQVVQAVA